MNETPRISASLGLRDVLQEFIGLYTKVKRRAVEAGVDPKLVELLLIRASQINACAFCLDMHIKDARKLGESDRRIDMLPAWHETTLYSEQERAALALTESITTLSEHREVPDDVYEEATRVFTEEQYVTLVWLASIINTFNRLNVTARRQLPPE
ncbi:alkylhydroperoxidase AhpD family core domain-containing protein [Streptoalloteichus tenebrarius]|uniref:Alkylhydroperoxidase AhpD family core domain-containing protein n=1 Tax=Streptoalloteichus tenebrarius (strain ATCC 17920 / DSM 40477 / JCM 4838 / CBS 697.72 / NBRC 16177 / NCIMB 11028 / NRRL B-12390 / A12253. 1 / ISP 5477) TaxID=1933 RepID=A0ABT1I1E7_STRSD|nr:carboxymuconolactone decarboxylase family protein [Streptoalloteichus tenebrarius]MCP2261602.1 alkylhydroperoxidase AhpD family core domain-containing protein [Streptoalloteichus tenebrarius]BFE99396.1 carboxymuconolactone decarboxylase family protein [Streptoalloteichus tenebrarius]